MYSFIARTSSTKIEKIGEKLAKWAKNNEEVSKWLSELERRSTSTADSRRYFLYRYCQRINEKQKIPTKSNCLFFISNSPLTHCLLENPISHLSVLDYRREV